MRGFRIEKPSIPPSSNGEVVTRLLLLGVYAVTSERPYRIGSPIASVTPCEYEIVGRGELAWPEPERAEVVIERFKGQLDRIEGDLAHVTLTDSFGEEFVADCVARRLTRLNIKEGDSFFCTILKTAGRVQVSYEPAPRKEVSKERQAAIRREVEDALTKLTDFPGF
jgi:hypothetical protein